MDNRCSVLAVFCLFVVCCVQRELKADEFNYEHQAKWYDEYKECSLDRQSPIELNSNEATITYDMPPLIFNHYTTPYRLPAQCENNGHTANLQLPKTKEYLNSLRQINDKLQPHITAGPLGSAEYVAESVHFHWGSKDAHGSEHVINSQRYSMEMHIVHRNFRYHSVEAARAHEDGLTVLAVLFAVQVNKTENFEGLNKVIETLESVSELKKSAEVNNFTLSALLGDMERTEFYTYSGSLTTPPCSQSVTWIVFKQPIDITHEQMQRFRQLADGHGGLLENNYRSLQAKGNRKVILRSKRKVKEEVTTTEFISISEIYDKGDLL